MPYLGTLANLFFDSSPINLIFGSIRILHPYAMHVILEGMSGTHLANLHQLHLLLLLFDIVICGCYKCWAILGFYIILFILDFGTHFCLKFPFTLQV